MPACHPRNASAGCRPWARQGGQSPPWTPAATSTRPAGAAARKVMPDTIRKRSACLPSPTRGCTREWDRHLPKAWPVCILLWTSTLGGGRRPGGRQPPIHRRRNRFRPNPASPVRRPIEPVVPQAQRRGKRLAPQALNMVRGGAAHQNSTPFCALMPDRNGCLTSVISVTRSAASISASFALRPVRITCVRGGLSSRRKVSTASRFR